jgi:hypothetical protein
VHLPAGTHGFRLIGVHDDTLSTAFDDADVEGLISAQFVADPVISATEDALVGTAMACYPNPTTGLVRVVMPELSGKGALRIFDKQGRMLRAAEVGDVSAFDVDLLSVSPGVYTVQVICEGRVGTAGIVRL